MTSGTPDPQTPAPRPQLIGLECRACGTRLYGRSEQVGKRLKCPDCGALNLLKAPVAPKPKKAPAALEGEQYEVWGPDEQPLPSELAALQPKYIAVVCRVCSTLMQATEDQVGQELVCPDCRARNVVPPPAKQKPAQSVLDSGDAYEVDASRDPGERPPVILPKAHTLLYEEEEETERTAAATSKKHRGKRRRTDARGRPVMPRFPLLTGVVSFLFDEAAVTRWFVLSVSLILVGCVLVDAVHTWYVWQPGKRNYGEFMAAAAALAQTLIGAITFLLWLGAASSIFVVVVSESSDGHDRVHGWPKLSFLDSVADMGYVVVGMMVSTVPGWIIGQFAAQEPWQRALWAGGCLLVCFPIVFLSQLAANSPWTLVSGNVLANMARRPFSCLLFYIESALLAAVCTVAVVLTADYHHLVPVLFAPLYVAALLLYCRLLGRLAWRIAVPGGMEEATPEEKQESGELPSRGQ